MAKNNNKVQKAKIVKEKKNFDFSNIKLGFRTLVNNEACLDAGKKIPFWVAIIILLFSIGLALIPIGVSAGKIQGSDFVNTVANESYYYGIPYFAESHLYDIQFKDGEATLYDSSNNVVTDKTTSLFTYARESKYEELNTTQLEILFFNGNKELAIAEINSNYVVNDNSKTNLIGHNFILFGQDYFYAYLKVNATNSTTIGGDYLHLNKDYNKETVSLINDILPLEKDGITLTKAEFFEQFKTFLNSLYSTNRTNIILAQIGIDLAINFSIVVLMGLMFFLLTRNKTNPYKQTKWYVFFNAAFWMSLSPGVIGLALGFLLGQFALLSFMFPYVLRSMLMTMRQIRAPQGQR